MHPCKRPACSVNINAGALHTPCWAFRQWACLHGRTRVVHFGLGRALRPHQHRMLVLSGCLSLGCTRHHTGNLNCSKQKKSCLAAIYTPAPSPSVRLQGDCAMASASGVNAILVPSSATAAMTQVHALSPDGRCKAFGAEADGYGRGEGYAAVVLEPARFGSGEGPALALFAGSAVNQDGRSSGLTAPHGPSQQALIQAAMREAGVPQLEYVATHGTGKESEWDRCASSSSIVTDHLSTSAPPQALHWATRSRPARSVRLWLRQPPRLGASLLVLSRR